jgi:hypothetical protein
MDLREERLSLIYEADRARLERDHLKERLSLLEGQLVTRRHNPPPRREDPRGTYHPYPRPSTRERHEDSRESSVGPERSRPSYRVASSSRQAEAPHHQPQAPRRAPVATPAPPPRRRESARSPPPVATTTRDMAQEMEEMEDDDEYGSGDSDGEL